ncbi:MDR family oxidoreductase [Humibacter sp.]|jgi:acrylyl-CoA reductase (NADPH)|uniref:MDR family oxidoreductase n=1 Tax=Humibacter sp. TaxID=1940291 RepID=UPI002C789AFC|nr:MDR family oxidoreductase [Humibacter sp.]HVX06864.1 MDR family oxidoreductase [Humibacter sp.]
MSFRALQVTQQTENGAVTAHEARVRTLDDDALEPADVEVDVQYSALNYKDGLALAGRPGVLRTSPIIPGIDLVGRVRSSADPRFMPGDHVVLNGDGIGETRNGGFAERAAVRGEALVVVPDAFTVHQAAAIGTAGFTAMLAVLALERGGVTPYSGPVLVTGAAGGVGSVAIAVLAKLGYQVTASTGRGDSEADYLRELGASAILNRADFAEPGRPLQKGRWAGAIDAVGGVTLANVLAQTTYGGVVASCGVAGGAELPATVMPFILRGVTLAGINSVEAPRSLRQDAWSRLARDLDVHLLDTMTSTIGLEDAQGAAGRILAGQIRGRTVVDVRH